ncbi:hypothetical protein Q2T52_15560 [Rhizobium oryzicola]|uniref:Uncharacterized protein n=2 Tax=Rhizobium oryzicola TaxID=1232668 RepID=A0ABT8SZ11_9HYPH|nr:hypothetical protein [Rhizobium oryzicola]
MAILPDEDRSEELVALARLLAYAKITARLLDAEVAAFCIDSALGAVVEQLSATTEGIAGLHNIADSTKLLPC